MPKERRNTKRRPDLLYSGLFSIFILGAFCYHHYTVNEVIKQMRELSNRGMTSTSKEIIREEEEYITPKQEDEIPDKEDSGDEEIPESFPGLRVIVAGLERSGTTVIGRLIMNAPCIIGATETGYLLAETPADIESIQPWFDWNDVTKYKSHFMYRLTPDNVAEMKNAQNFAEMYDILRNRSHLFNELNDEKYCKKPYQIVDKTPKYVHPNHFEKILKKTPNVPVIVMQKSFESVQESKAKRGHNLKRDYYDSVYNNVAEMKKKYPNRIMVVQLDKLMENPDVVMTNVFGFLGLNWDREYLKMSGLKKKFSRYPSKLEALDEWEFVSGKHSPSLAKVDT